MLWALRGAGANFGVTTSLECRLHSIGPVTSGEIYYPVREARPVLRFFRNLMAEAPDSFQATLNLTPGERGVFVSLCHAGDGAEAERLLRAFRTVATLAKDTVKGQEFAELAGVVPPDTPDASFRCVATVYRNELSDEVVCWTEAVFMSLYNPMLPQEHDSVTREIRPTPRDIGVSGRRKLIRLCVPSHIAYEVGAARQQTVRSPRTMDPHS